MGRIRGSRDERETGHGRNRRQGLATEPEGTDGCQLLEAGELGSRVAGEGQCQFRTRNPPPIVTHPNQPQAAPLDLHLDGMGAGIQTVLDQFLGHRRGPFHHLAGGDLVDKRGREDADGHPPW